jgi:RNA polymerase sigma factor (sigma-70 family)
LPHQYRSLLTAIARVSLLLFALTAIQPLSADAATPALSTDEIRFADDGDGDDQQFAAAFRQHYAGLRNYFERALGNHAEAEEAAQETLLRLYAGNRAACPEPADVKRWLYSVARNHAIDLLRRRSRNERATGPSDLVDHSDRLQQRTAPPGPLSADFETLLPVIARLPQRQQQVLGLRYRLSFTTAETAAALGMSPDNVRQAERRALSFLRARV